MEELIIDLEPVKNIKYQYNVKYSTREYIMGIIEVITTCTSWRRYPGEIDGRVLNNKHNHYVKIGVYDALYKLT